MERKEGSTVVQHMGEHFLHDGGAKGLVNPCRFCLSTGQVCFIYLKKAKGSDRANTIDMRKSRCPNLCTIKLGFAAKSSAKSLCTNVPLICPLCPKDVQAVWKYNMKRHIESIHPEAKAEDYADLYTISTTEIS